MQLLQHSVRPLVRQAFGPRGAAMAQLIADWHVIAGDMATLASPKDIRFSRDKNPGRLVLACSSAIAPEISMQIPLLLERIQRHFGYQLIAHVVLEHN